jgi:hypothetical protein
MEGCTQVGVTSERVGGGEAGTSGFAAGYAKGDGFVGREVSAGVWDCVEGCPVRELDRQSGYQRDGSTKIQHGFRTDYVGGEGSDAGLPPAGYGGEGGASRFFYVAKANASERPRDEGVAHPTVKPLDLMRWLVRLVTPPGGVVLDPFLGSGTTAEACIVEGFRCVGVERETDYLPLIVQRVSKPIEPVMF